MTPKERVIKKAKMIIAVRHLRFDLTPFTTVTIELIPDFIRIAPSSAGGHTPAESNKCSEREFGLGVFAI
jgi:hypothetical protein